MIFRRATVHDVAELIALDAVAATEGNRARQIEVWVAEGTCYLLDESGVRAYGVLNRHFHNQPFIEMLMIDRRHRRRGFGLKLLESLCGLAPGENVWTSTNRSNQPMRDLLTTLGFQPRGEIDIDPGDPELYYCLSQN